MIAAALPFRDHVVQNAPTRCSEKVRAARLQIGGMMLDERLAY